jgi:hypothetical protein
MYKVISGVISQIFKIAFTFVRLAAAGCLHTAVALELAAGQA